MLDEKEFEDIAKTILTIGNYHVFRFHYFFRNIEGIWASVKPDEIDEAYIYSDRRKNSWEIIFYHNV